MTPSSTDKMIKVTMISNAMSHHQFPFCDAMSCEPGIDFRFVATAPVSPERLKIGFSDLNASRDYIVRAYESADERVLAQKLANESDFVIFGSAPYEMIKKRRQEGKPTFIYSERLFKETRKRDLFNIKTITACTLRYRFSRRRGLHLLCSSAFSSNDYRFFGFKPDVCLKWGYFPPVSKKTASELLSQKDHRRLIWTGRMIWWKHPEDALLAAKKLKEAGASFSLKMIGDGPLIEEMKRLAMEYGLSDIVTFTGSLEASSVRAEMEKAAILLSTSDRNEGWGAVINEGMASGCAVVASHLMGAVPYLICDGKNGRIYQSGNVDDLFSKTAELLNDAEKRDALGRVAYQTISEIWNGANAAKRLAEIMRKLHAGEVESVYESGPCSRAEIIKDDWFITTNE